MESIKKLINILRARLKKISWLHSFYMVLKPIVMNLYYRFKYSIWSEQVTPKIIYTKRSKIKLKKFLKSKDIIDLGFGIPPRVSIVIPVFNKAELTLDCLKSLQEARFKFPTASFEVIIINNNSTDLTELLLKKTSGVRIINNKENLHFLRASNQGARFAEGEYVLFLNNDTVISPDAIVEGLRTFDSDSLIGAVGAKLVLPGGSLQEAGCIVWGDGSCYGIGRGGDPGDGQYNFKKEVDFCSGAYLLTKKSILEELNYFDEIFAPAYYEEVDFCLRIKSMGLKIIYNPKIYVRHFEFGSSNANEPTDLMLKNREVFLGKHKDFLQTRSMPNAFNIIKYRDLNHYNKRVLYIDDRVPLAKYGSGFPRALDIIRIFRSIDHFVTIFPTHHNFSFDSYEQIYLEHDDQTEIINTPDGFLNRFRSFIKERVGYYDYIWISRPTTMNLVRIATSDLSAFGNAKIIYDAEAFFSEREVRELQLNNISITPEAISSLYNEEFSLAKSVHAITTVSSKEKELFDNYFKSNLAKILPFMMENTITISEFTNRVGLLFVGAIHSDLTPNADSVLWFCHNVLPILRSKGFTDPVYIVGTNLSSLVSELDGKNGVHVIGRVDSLGEWYNRARVFIAPTRFAAGIPFKVVEAASYGVPAVVTTLLAGQLSWKSGEDYLVADEAEDFSESILNIYADENLWRQVRLSAVDTVQQHYSLEYFSAIIDEVLK